MFTCRELRQSCPMSKATFRLYPSYRIPGKRETVLVLNQQQNHEGAWTIGGIAPNIVNLSPRQKWSALRPGRFTFREIFL